MEIKCHRNIIRIVDDDETFNIISCGFIEKIFEDVDILSILLEKDGTIIYSCENCKKIIHVDILNKKLSDILPHDSYEEIRKMMLEAMFTNKQIINEVKIKRRTFNTMVTPIFNKDMNIKYLSINSYDISKSKKIEEEIESLKTKLDESNAIKSIFLSNISHELRTPMNAIIGFSDLLLQNEQTEDQRFLKSINSNAKHLDELLNNIIDSSRMESNEFDILYENFSINDLFDELFDVFDDVNYKKNLDFVKLEFVKDKDKKIISDYLRLKQVLFNIISNSIKFTDTGYIRISFSTSGKFIIFKIEDTGIGIDENKIKYVFDRFWQCDSSSTKKYKGTGLGLAISKSIIDMLDGNIWLESVINKGTTFYVKIPLEEIKHDILIENKNKISFSGKTVLIIDELPINYSLLGLYLNSLNINILSAYSGEEAIEIYKKQKEKIELIFLDLNLPDIDSIKLLAKLKIINPNCKIITKSGSSKNENELVDYHLLKPINKDKLLIILNEIWQK